jgi:hypothetical protein
LLRLPKERNKAGEHAMKEHNMNAEHMTPELKQKIRGLILNSFFGLFRDSSKFERPVFIARLIFKYLTTV